MVQIISEFMVKMFSLPKRVVIWLQVLMLVNMVAPLFFWAYSEAKLIIAVFLVNFITGAVLYKKHGFTKILGLMHWAWIPLVIFLLTKWNDISTVGFYGLWIKSVVVLNSISLFFDVKDVIEYFQGDHKSLIE